MTLQLRETEAPELVDALVAVADAYRSEEIDRLRLVLDDLGLGGTFDAEFRLNGVGSVIGCELCGEACDG